MNIDLTTIEKRIKENQLELAVLRQSHDQMVAVAQAQQQEFQQRVSQNQLRFQQLTGAIGELEQLRQSLLPKGTNNEQPNAGSGSHPKPVGKDSQGPERKIRKETLTPTRT